jgi:hypothetical protein
MKQSLTHSPCQLGYASIQPGRQSPNERTARANLLPGTTTESADDDTGENRMSNWSPDPEHPVTGVYGRRRVRRGKKKKSKRDKVLALLCPCFSLTAGLASLGYHIAEFVKDSG